MLYQNINETTNTVYQLFFSPLLERPSPEFRFLMSHQAMQFFFLHLNKKSQQVKEEEAAEGLYTLHVYHIIII
jgi:hypothetical protein